MRIQGVIPPPVPLDQALGFLENEARRSCRRASRSTTRASRGQLRTEGSKFLGTFLLSAILIYLVLAAQFESFRDPFIILAGSVPLAVSGALLFSFLGLTTLNIYSQVGLITLVGLVSKNGILIVQFANHLQETGKDKLPRSSRRPGTRLRPILMTTAATVVGHFPLVIATGPGAGARNSIGIMLVSGMIIGTLFTLFVVPSITCWWREPRGGVGGGDASRRKEQRRMSVGSFTRNDSIVGALAVAVRVGADGAGSRAREPRRDAPLTLDAVRRAVENNPDLAIVRLDTEVEAARSAKAAARSRRCSRPLGRSMPRRRAAANLLLGERGVDDDDWFSSTGVRQRLPWGSGTWSVSWDASRTTTNNPLTSFDPSLQSGFSWRSRSRCSGTARSTRRGTRYTIAKRNLKTARISASARRSCRPWRR